MRFQTLAALVLGVAGFAAAAAFDTVEERDVCGPCPLDWVCYEGKCMEVNNKRDK
jgi:hypothetical protein